MQKSNLSDYPGRDFSLLPGSGKHRWEEQRLRPASSRPDTSFGDPSVYPGTETSSFPAQDLVSLLAARSLHILVWNVNIPPGLLRGENEIVLTAGPTLKSHVSH